MPGVVRLSCSRITSSLIFHAWGLLVYFAFAKSSNRRSLAAKCYSKENLATGTHWQLS